MAENKTPTQASSTSKTDSPSPKGTPTTTLLDSASKLIQVLSVVVGVIITVLSFNAARKTEARAREAEAKAKELELKKYYDQRKDEADKKQAEAPLLRRSGFRQQLKASVRPQIF